MNSAGFTFSIDPICSLDVGDRLGRPRGGRDRLAAVVAIPAKDEADRLADCLLALSKQVDSQGGQLRDAFGVVVFANNCQDDTAEVARRAAQHCTFEVRVVEAQLPKAASHAGGARRKAMDLAASWLREKGVTDGVILTTDADSWVSPNWISANLAEFAQGADVVLGRISLDEDGARLPAALHARGKLEAVYEDLLTEIAARLDPQDFNPWPHHATISGATLGVTRKMYARVGGVPRIRLGEDKALVAKLRRLDARIRFAPDVQVITSGRVVGRAPGGVADTLRLRSDNPRALCDEALEPCATAFTRAIWRGRLRRNGFGRDKRWSAALGVPASSIPAVLAAPTFGAAWDAVEKSARRLRRSPLAPAELPRQIERATCLLRRLQERLASDENVQSVFGAPLAPDDLREGLSAGDEKLGGRIAG